MLVALTFWDAFWLMLIWVPLITLWIFALADIFRRDDLRGMTKALWVACIVFIPYFGSFLYMISRSAAKTRAEGYPSHSRPNELA